MPYVASEVGGRDCRQPGQIRKEAATTISSRVAGFHLVFSGGRLLLSFVSKVAGKTGLVLIALLFFALVGSALTAFIGAPFAAIPIFDFLVGLPLMPFPTVFVYFSGISVIYFLVIVAFAKRKRPSRQLEFAALTSALLVVGLLAWMIPWQLNREAGVLDMESNGNWKPLDNWRGERIALISEDWDSGPCNAFCLSLLVTGRAQEVLIGHPKFRPIRNTTSLIEGHAVRLGPSWKSCFSQLADYSSSERSDKPARLEEFKDFGLDPKFGDALVGCLDVRSYAIDPSAQVTLINWHDFPTGSGAPEQAAVGIGPLIGVQQIRFPLETDFRFRFLRNARRYSVPAFLFPYAGNAGSGSRFELSWDTEEFQTISSAENASSAWWTMLKESDDLAKGAVEILDSTVSPRRPDYSHER